MVVGTNGQYVVMGVAGSGKSLIGAALARALGVSFIEGDDYHSAANVARMASGAALTDDDRADWLRSLAGELRQAHASGTGLVMTCSALKRSYRDILRADLPAIQFIFLRGDKPLIVERLGGRTGHFMPPSQVGNQFAILEEPGPDERAWTCDIRESPDGIVARLVELVLA